MAGEGLYSQGRYQSSERSKLDTFVRAALQSFETDDYDAQKFSLYEQPDTDNQNPFTLQDFCKLLYRVRQFTEKHMTASAGYLQVELPELIEEEHIQSGCEGGHQCVWVRGAEYPAQLEARHVGAIAMIHLKNGPSLWYYRRNEQSGSEHAEKLVIDVIREWLQKGANLENLKKIVLYVTYQPCHRYTTKGGLVLSCTNTVIDFYEARLRSHQIKFIIKIPYLHCAHWNPEKGSDKTRDKIDKQKEGLVKLLNHDSIQLQAMDQLDWKLLHGLALQI